MGSRQGVLGGSVGPVMVLESVSSYMRGREVEGGAEVRWGRMSQRPLRSGTEPQSPQI